MSLLGEGQHNTLSPRISSSDGVSVDTQEVNQVISDVVNDEGSEQMPMQRDRTADAVSPTEFAKIKSSHSKFQATLQRLQV